ncbi:MCE family protein [Streptacidiphilus sp. PB12-B1b]|uniref:MCE family protein n=1 Tax=Streptacidiphilus sp. PB12-B1b TaxID=2705012 RepID=UPI0015FD19CB|nr:MCE family protein [Streptacidiphilus sp. PB12-B1b]QMU77732.1 MCE family protein [Streptacidiphilus sp. PB12-B1b]
MRPPLFKPLRQRNPVWVGLVGVVVCALAALTAYDADALPLVGSGGTHYSAYFSESAGLDPGDEVSVAGVKVGTVDSVALDGAQVKVGFRVQGAWVGDASTVSIGIRTLLGAKYLAVDPLGDSAQNPSLTIPRTRTTSPFDVTQALDGLGQTLGSVNSKQLAQSFQAIADTFKDTPPSVRSAVDGLSALSQTISSRDAALAKLLSASATLTGTVADQNSRLASLIDDGNQLLAEVQSRRDAIHALLTGTTQLGAQLTGLVQDDDRQLAPTLSALSRVVSVLQANQTDLDQVLALAGPYYAQLGDALGSGRWFDVYLCGLIPAGYLPSDKPPSDGCASPTTGGTGK